LDLTVTAAGERALIPRALTSATFKCALMAQLKTHLFEFLCTGAMLTSNPRRLSGDPEWQIALALTTEAIVSGYPSPGHLRFKIALPTTGIRAQSDFGRMQ
jgi:hypothetical protein